MENTTLAPHDRATEEAVLAAMLTRPEIIDDLPAVEPELFFLDGHRFICEAITAITDRHEPVDELTVLAELRAMSAPVSPGYLTGVINGFMGVKNIDVYIEMLVRLAKRRELLETLARCHQEVLTTEGTTAELLASVEADILTVTQGYKQTTDNTLRSAMYELFDAVEDRQANGTLAGISTGYREYDQMTNGLHRGQVTIIGGRTSMGKTAFMLNLAYNALCNGYKVGFLSLEMGKQEIGGRLMAMHTGMDSRHIEAGTFTDAHWQKFVLGTDDLAKMTMEVEYCPGLTLTRMNAICRRLKRLERLDVLFVDYIGLMRAEGPAAKQNANTALSSISNGMKEAAGVYDIPIVVAAQVNRELKDTTDKRPALWHLRDSGSLEQDADVVAFVHRPDYYQPKDRPGVAEIIIAKQRNGPVGGFNLKFVKEQNRFVE